MFDGGRPLAVPCLIAGVLSLLLLAAPAAAQQPELFPDLQGQPAEDLSIDNGPGLRDLRLSTTVANGGMGPFEIYPTAGGDCDGDGNPANDKLAFQRVFRDVDDSGFFNRVADTDSVSYPAGCMIYHTTHAHWHFEDFARYELRMPGTGEPVASTSKVSFCLVDFSPFDPTLPGFSNTNYYNRCDENDTEGMSVGWGDTYEAHLDGQTIDIRDLPDGDYCLAVTGDPSDIVRETNEANNESLNRITLDNSSVTYSSASCDSAVRPPPPPSGAVPTPTSTGKPKCKRAKRGAKRGAKKKSCKRRSRR